MDEKRQTPEEVDRVEIEETDLESVSGGDPPAPPPPPTEWGDE